MTIRLLAIASLVILASLWLPPPPGCLAQPVQTTQTTAETPWPVAGICLQPADSNTSIALRSLRVEITLVEQESVTLAQVWTRFSLVNPSRTTPIQSVVGLPTWSAGDHFFRPTDVQDLSVTVNDTPVSPTPRSRPQVENETWLAWDMSFDILDRQFVEVAYTTTLEVASVPRVAFALSSGAVWADQVESAAVIVVAPRPFQHDQVLDAYPADAQHDGQQLSWHWEAFEPAEDVGFAYITRTLWGRVEAARADLADVPTAANHRALGLLYLTLADHAAFFAQAVAELETAAALDPTDVETHRALAQAYQTRGSAVGDIAYLELAARHWQQVLTLGDAAARADASANLRRCHYTLAQTLLAQQAYPQALEHLEAALALPVAGSDVSDATLAQQRERTRRTWAADLFQAGEDAEATAVLQALGDPYQADYQAYAPAFTRVQGQIATHIAGDGGTRQIVVTWTPFATTVLTDTAALARSLQSLVPEAQVRALPDDRGLDVTMSFASPTKLREMLAALGRETPPEAASAGHWWDPVRAILTSGEIAYDEADVILWKQIHYREVLPLHAPAADLLRQRQALDALIETLADQASSVPEDPTTLRLTALHSYRTALDRLLDSHVSSQVTVTRLADYPQASLDAALGQDRVLEVSDREWNRPALALVGGGAVSLLLLLALAYLVARRPGMARRP